MELIDPMNDNILELITLSPNKKNKTICICIKASLTNEMFKQPSIIWSKLRALHHRMFQSGISPLRLSCMLQRSAHIL